LGHGKDEHRRRTGHQAPIAAVLYLIFTHLSHDIMEYIAGGVVFLLGLDFVIKGSANGIRGRIKEESEASRAACWQAMSAWSAKEWR
jgi:hypothetical protein